MPRYALPDLNDALWTFRTANFVIALYAEEEHMDPEDSLEFDENVAFARSGEPAAWFSAAVRVFLLDEDGDPLEEVGADHLGGCSYRSFEDFMASHRDPDPANRNTLAMKAQNCVLCHYFPDMVRQACASARAELKRRRDLFHALKLRETNDA